MSKFVWSTGPTPNKIMLLSQGPGKVESATGVPFTGPSGEQQKMYMSYFGLRQSDFYIANLFKEWRPKNPTPGESDIAKYAPMVEGEIANCNPRVIGAIGHIAAQWLLAPHYPDLDLSMEMIHGLAFQIPGHRIVIPVEHPASGLYSPSRKTSIFYDYSQLSQAIDDPTKCRYVVENKFTKPLYKSVDGEELIKWLSFHLRCTHTDLAIDTEGDPRTLDLWSIQFSMAPGTGYTMRYGCLDFDEAIQWIQKNIVDVGHSIIVYNGLFDVPMCRYMGLELSRCNIHDPMYALYVLGGFERMSLAVAGWRFCGAATQHFEDVCGPSAFTRQIDYLERASQIDWGKPEKRIVTYNNGVSKDYKPTGLNSKFERILADLLSVKLDKDGKPPDPLERFYCAPGGEEFHKELSRDMLSEVELELGAFPSYWLGDLPDSQSVPYECADVDIALRLHYALQPILAKHNVTHTYEAGMKTLPAIEECQHTGMPASRAYFVDLKRNFEQRAEVLRADIAHEYFDDGPFNPRSTIQVRELITDLGAVALDRTKPSTKYPDGQMSVGENSIRYLEGKHPVIRKLFRAKHLRHLAGSFCTPILDRIEPECDLEFVHSRWSMTRTPTRRLATSGKQFAHESGFNLLNQPQRDDDSLLIRKGFVCSDGEIMVSADLSQIEPRVLAHYSQDTMLLDVYNNDRDLYVEEACLLEGLFPGEVTSKIRMRSKTRELGMMYGYGPATMMKLFFKDGVFDYDEEGCAEQIDLWYAGHPGVTELKNRLARNAKPLGCIVDASGMPRYVPDVRSPNIRDRSQAERYLLSHLIQGGAQTCIQNAMQWLIRKFWAIRDMGINVRLALQIHDELLAIVPDFENVPDMIGELLVRALTQHAGMELSVPLVAGYTKHKTWAGLKD